jgi:integrase
MQSNPQKNVKNAMVYPNIREEKGIRRIDERRLNVLLRTISPDAFARFVSKKQPRPSSSSQKIQRSIFSPKNMTAAEIKVNRIVRDIGLLDEHDNDRKALAFIGACKMLQYSLNTTKRYFGIALREGLFGKTCTIRPDATAFDSRIHIRVVSMEDLLKLANYLHSHLSEMTAPSLIGFYTGLRTMEILQFSTLTIVQLHRRDSVIPIRRKNTTGDSLRFVHWTPVYNVRFISLVDALVNLYNLKILALNVTKTDEKLFHVTPKTLVTRLKNQFYQAVGRLPPLGFGIHSFRNMIASIMSNETKNIFAIQHFLQHKNSKTTQRYLNMELLDIKNEFNRLTDIELQDVRRAFDGELLQNENDNKRIP